MPENQIKITLNIADSFFSVNKNKVTPVYQFIEESQQSENKSLK
jgi:hypothetical protein